MTAQRWWVEVGARWLARIDGVKGQVQMLSLAVTAFSTFGVLLQGFGLGKYVPYIGAAIVLAGITYTYLFAEGGVWNQVGKDRAEMATDYAGPNHLIQGRLVARSIIAGSQGEELSDEQREALKDESQAAFEDCREGVLDG